MFFQSSSPGAAGGAANTRGGGSAVPLAHLAHLVLAFRDVSAHRARIAATTTRSALATRRILFQPAVFRRRLTRPSSNCSKSALPLLHPFAYHALEVQLSAIFVRLKQCVARGLILWRLTRRAREGELGLFSTRALLHSLRRPLRLHTCRTSSSLTTPTVVRSLAFQSILASFRSSSSVAPSARVAVYGVANGDASSSLLAGFVSSWK